MKTQKGAVAAGHPFTVDVAKDVLHDGGNAFDAAVAAQLAAFVAEPVLTSLGGGGFLFAEKGSGRQVVYDFFVQTPVQKTDPAELDFYPVNADFGEVLQEYHIGAGSVATPGMAKGLFEIHRDLCSLPMRRLAEPAIDQARRGVEMNSFQSSIFDIVRPIYKSSEKVSRIFGSKRTEGGLIGEGEILKQPELADTLDALVRDGDDLFYRGEIADSIVSISQQLGGYLSEKDLDAYHVVRRDPLTFSYKSHQIAINPPPGTGGLLIGFALKLLESLDEDVPEFGSREYIIRLAELQQMTDKARVASLAGSGTEEGGQLLSEDFLQLYRQKILDRLSAFNGTTQISIVDGDGNKASLTSSNGEGSGVMIPGTGIMLNNMLGEEDLNPGGFHRWTPNQRVSSMMSPGILKLADGRDIVFGSGGSNRIRTAILQLLINLVDYKMTLPDAVNSPRLHLEAGQLNAERGFDSKHFQALIRQYPNQKIWKKRALFFGGAHSVSIGPKGFEGTGDVRRGGEARIVS